MFCLYSRNTNIDIFNRTAKKNHTFSHISTHFLYLAKKITNILSTMNNTPHTPNNDRYDHMKYNRLGVSSVTLPAISLGLWHNFGSNSPFEKSRQMIYHAFDIGINHFDLANNYGPDPGSAETNFGRILREGMLPYRDELMISTKAGHEMWDGPLGGNSSRKHLFASIDQSLARMGLKYVDIFYTHRYDGSTPIEETARALSDIVRSGRSIYIGISKYPPAEAEKLYRLLAEERTPAVVAQYRYSLFERTIEQHTIAQAADAGAGLVAFSPLAQGLLSDRYLDGVPADSRAASSSKFLSTDALTTERLDQIRALNQIARERGESLSQMALAWAMRDKRMTSLIIGASSTQQIDENIKACSATPFTSEQLDKIDNITLK